MILRFKSGNLFKTVLFLLMVLVGTVGVFFCLLSALQLVGVNLWVTPLVTDGKNSILFLILSIVSVKVLCGAAALWKELKRAQEP